MLDLCLISAEIAQKLRY